MSHLMDQNIFLCTLNHDLTDFWLNHYMQMRFGWATQPLILTQIQISAPISYHKHRFLINNLLHNIIRTKAHKDLLDCILNPKPNIQRLSWKNLERFKFVNHITKFFANRDKREKLVKWWGYDTFRIIYSLLSHCL